MTAVDLKSGGKTADVVVIGGGLHGCSAALHLSLRGLQVIVLEKDTVGRHASGVNAGGVRRLGRALAEIPLSLASAKLWHNIEELVDDDCGFRSSCHIRVAENALELNALKSRVAEVVAHGFGHEQIIDQKTLRDLVPQLAPHCVGAIRVEGDGHANPFRTVQAFRRKATALGTRIYERTPVRAMSRVESVWRIASGPGASDIFEAPFVVNCAGAWGGQIAALLEEPVPLRARAPMLMITAPMARFITPVVGAEGRTLSFKQFDNGTVLIGGGHEGTAHLDSGQTTLNSRGLSVSARTAATLFPIMRKAQIVRQWAGIEGMMADEIPVIGLSQQEGVVHGFGFCAHGFQLGPIGGKIMSDLVVDGETDLPIAPFRITRFG